MLYDGWVMLMALRHIYNTCLLFRLSICVSTIPTKSLILSVHSLWLWHSTSIWYTVWSISVLLNVKKLSLNLKFIHFSIKLLCFQLIFTWRLALLCHQLLFFVKSVVIEESFHASIKNFLSKLAVMDLFVFSKSNNREFPWNEESVGNCYVSSSSRISIQ